MVQAGNMWTCQTPCCQYGAFRSKQQLLLDGQLILATPLKKQHWHTEDVTAGQVFTDANNLFLAAVENLILF